MSRAAFERAIASASVSPEEAKRQTSRDKVLYDSRRAFEQGTQRYTPPPEVAPTGVDTYISRAIRDQATEGDPYGGRPIGMTPPPAVERPAAGTDVARAGVDTGGGAGARGSAGGAGGGRASAPERSLDLDEITAALEAISAMFNLQEGELTAEQQAARQAFDFLKQGLLGAERRAIDQTTNQAAGRGILRSGLYLTETGRIKEDVAGQINQARAEKLARERAIQQRLAGLDTAEAAQRAQEARRIAKEQVGTKEAIARALELV